MEICSLSSVVHQTGCLDGVSGPEGRVPLGLGPSGWQVLSEVRLLRGLLSVQSFVLLD